MRWIIRLAGLSVTIISLLMAAFVLPHPSTDEFACLYLATFPQMGSPLQMYMVDGGTGFMALMRHEFMWTTVSTTPRVRMLSRLQPYTQAEHAALLPPQYQIGLGAMAANGSVDTRDIVPITAGISTQWVTYVSSPDIQPLNPLWSPDWTQVSLFWEDAIGNDTIRLINEDGSNPRTLHPNTMKGKLEQPLAWSADNRYLVTQTNAGNTRYTIWDTQTLHEIKLPISAPMEAAVWSPVAPLLGLLVKHDDAPSQVLLYAATDGAQHLVTLAANMDAQTLVWSPTGAHLAVVGYRRTVAHSAAGLGPKMYQFVTAEGTLLPDAPTGMRGQWISENSGYTVRAGLWSANGDRWYFLEDVPDSIPTEVRLRAYEAATGKMDSIATRIPLEWAPEVFNEAMQIDDLRRRGTTPSTPAEQRPNARRDLILTTRQQDASLNVDILDTQTGQQTRLITGADALSQRGGFVPFRLRDSYTDEAWIVIDWLKGDVQHLAWLAANSDQPHDVTDVPTFLSMTRNRNYLFYRRYEGDQLWSVMLLDLRTGQQRALLTNLPPFATIQASVAQTGDRVGIVVDSELYLAALDGSWSRYLGKSSQQMASWLPVAQNKLAYLKLDGTRLRLVVSDAAGNPIFEHGLPLDANTSPLDTGLYGWARCSN